MVDSGELCSSAWAKGKKKKRNIEFRPGPDYSVGARIMYAVSRTRSTHVVEKKNSYTVE